MKILKRGGTNGKKPSNKVRIFLKGLSASSSKGTPQFAEPDKKDYGKKKKGAKSVPQKMSKGGLTKKQKALDKNKDGKISGADFKMMKKGGKVRMYKKGGSFRAGLSAAEKEVYDRGLAAYMSSGNRPNVSQHQWAAARVKSAFGKKEAKRIASGKSKKKK